MMIIKSLSLYFQIAFGTTLDKLLEHLLEATKHIPSTIVKVTTPYPMTLLETGLRPIELVSIIRVYSQVTK